MIKGTTKSGFDYEVNEKILGDWRFLHAMADANSGDAERQLEGMVALPVLLLGRSGEARLCKHLEEDGIVDRLKVAAALGEIIQAVKLQSNQAKN